MYEIHDETPHSYYKIFKVDISNFYSHNKQLSFTSLEVINKITKLLATESSKFVNNLAILTCFDYSFLEYIIDENCNYNPNAKKFKKSNNEVDSTYYSNVNKFKMKFVRNLENLYSDRKVEDFLYRNTDIAAASPST